MTKIVQHLKLILMILNLIYPDKAPEIVQHDSHQQEDSEQDAIMLLKHIKEIAKLKYESELKREDSLIKQSSQMQTVFSFVTGSIFMAVTVIISNRGKLSLKFFLVAISCIMIFLIVSLVTASLAQQRKIQNTFPDVYVLEKFVSDNWEDTMKESQRLKQWIDLVAKVQIEKSNLNNKRVNYIRFSMGSFYGAIISIIFWFIVGVIKIL
ncbi:hypothetical protein [Clostridium estertheticum]|uniref:hypothetical protein n=1 Tax=Clostridium estertheticum TaxID=238834 RepID=UPI001C7D8E96|nr:hypothetical protein [Clostridium estertheticum]MBX4268896.1 hypothetical protein [Clostridium estertheticum]WLC78911.1 hypothetical protein KTC98_17200 [Clostridium estertheticum]